MYDELKEIYKDILNENETVGTVKPGELDGASKNAKPIKKVSTPDNTVETPDEGKSAEEVKKGGITKNSKKAEDQLKGSKNVKENKSPITTKFEELYKTVIGEDIDLEDDNDDIVKAPELEGDQFDDETGDFDDDVGNEDVEEEVDIATELRAMADRLNELADQYSEGDTDDVLGDDELGDELGEDGDDETFGLEDEEIHGESMKNQPEPRPAKKTQFGPKMSKTAKGKLSKVSAKKANTNFKGKYDGVPQKLGDKGARRNQSGMTVKGKGATVSKKATDAFV